MNANLLFDFTVDKENKTINVKREFAAPVGKVWAAWTQSDLLDQWWAPKPWKAKTKSQDFSEGGRWLYAMVGPNGEEHWSTADYKSIRDQKSFSALNAFSDENGKANTDMPRTNWTTSFSSNEDKTLVDIVIDYESDEAMKTELEMGFKEGFTMGMENLDELLAKQS